MTVSRATKTLTLSAGLNVDKDSYSDLANPTTVHGGDDLIFIGGTQAGGNRAIGYVTIRLPAAPGDADTDQAYSGIVAITL